MYEYGKSKQTARPGYRKPPPPVPTMCERRGRHTWIGDPGNRVCLVCGVSPNEEAA